VRPKKSIFFDLSDVMLDTIKTLVDGMAAQKIIFEEAVRPYPESDAFFGEAILEEIGDWVI